MTILTRLEYYLDKRGNEIHYDKSVGNVKVTLRGSNNTLIIAPGARIGRFSAEFDGDNGHFAIGNGGKGAFSGFIRVGQDSKVTIGNDVSTNGICVVSAVEGTSVTIGNDVMMAMENEIRADDSHPIFDVRTGKRVNESKSIIIGDHVWLAKRAVVLGGSSIGSGSVLGFGSVLTGNVPNNCVAAGVPARVVRRDVVWERPHLSMTQPPYKPDASSIERTAFWNLSE